MGFFVAGPMTWEIIFLKCISKQEYGTCEERKLIIDWSGSSWKVMFNFELHHTQEPGRTQQESCREKPELLKN